MKFQFYPEDYSDLSQAQVLLTLHSPGKLAWTTGTGWLWYNGQVWKADSEDVQKAVQELACQQAVESKIALKEANKKFTEADAAVTENPKDENAKKQREVASNEYNIAKSYLSYAVGEKQSPRIKGCMAQAIPLANISIKNLDRDPFLLNCPGGTYDLHAGKMKTHHSKDYCTHMTAFDPGDQGREEWFRFLNQVTCGDTHLAEYLQTLFGRACIGRVYTENLTILYGGGGNGKSSLTNAIKAVMGDYAIQSTPLLLTSDEFESSKQHQMGTLRGARLALMSELEAGQELDSATLKHLVSTDDIYVNPKYKDPYYFTPSHTTVLSTNHLPHVSSQDKGTWDRITVVPFKADFRGKPGAIENYGEGLVRRCGPAIMQWLIDGAEIYMRNDYKMTPPATVQEETDTYREENDWLVRFVASCCETGPGLNCPSSDLYNAYRDYTSKIGEVRVNQATFNNALHEHGYFKRKTARGYYFDGLRIFHTPQKLSISVSNNEALDWNSEISDY